MSATSGPGRLRRSALAVSAVAAALALTATACGGTDDRADGPGPSPTASPGDRPGKDERHHWGLPDKLPSDLPTSLEDLDKWRDGAWKNWDRDQWLRAARDFVNPIIHGLWDADRMDDADGRGNDRSVGGGDVGAGRGDGAGTGAGGNEDEGVTDPVPAEVTARAVRTPYTEDAPPVGKVFMDTPKGPMVCSGTVVADPRHPGRSDLVATAGHCVHAGAEGGWFRNVVFVPQYNPGGLSDARLEGASRAQVAPHGVWWAKYAGTTDYWIRNGSDKGGKAAPLDFAVLKVQPEESGGPSLEEAVGGAVKVDFTTPPVRTVGSLTAFGYPAVAPYDGARMYGCTDRPRRLTLDRDLPTMYRVGCSMTGGSSGGGWLTANGRELLSVTSVGPLEGGWLAGARLGREAEGVFDRISRR